VGNDSIFNVTIPTLDKGFDDQLGSVKFAPYLKSRVPIDAGAGD
jgi:hypothetical protein